VGIRDSDLHILHPSVAQLKLEVLYELFRTLASMSRVRWTPHCLLLQADLDDEEDT
jgi:hypothetical protein